MAERLTQSSSARPSFCLRFLPGFLSLIATAFWFWLPVPADAAFAGASRLYHTLWMLLPSPHLLQALSQGAFLLAVLLLVPRMLPAKTPCPTAAAAQSLVWLALLIPLQPWFAASLAGDPLPLALACMFGAWSLSLAATDHSRTPWLGAAGLLCGLGAGLSLFTLTGLLPLGVYLLMQLRKEKPALWKGLLFLVLGFAVGLLPEWASLRERMPLSLSPDAAHALSAFRHLYTALGVLGLALMGLALLVTLLQKQPVLLGLLLPAWLLQKAFLGLAGTPPRLLGASLVLPAIFFGYGAFRIARGLENGLQSVHPVAAKVLMRAIPILILLAFSLWSWNRLAA